MNTTNLIIIIGVIAIIAIIGGMAIVGLSKPTIQIPPVIIPPEVKPPYKYEVKCYDMCYSLMKNYSTKGYDPRFLAIPLVKPTCIDAIKDGAILGFCSKELGTL